MLAYVVAQRTREIGVRLALGATRARVIGMVLGDAGLLVATGMVTGTIASWYLSGISKAYLFRLEPTDPRTFAVAVLSLLIAALIATIIPARRAASVDPMVALRSE